MGFFIGFFIPLMYFSFIINTSLVFYLKKKKRVVRLRNSVISSLPVSSLSRSWNYSFCHNLLLQDIEEFALAHVYLSPVFSLRESLVLEILRLVLN